MPGPHRGPRRPGSIHRFAVHLRLVLCELVGIDAAVAIEIDQLYARGTTGDGIGGVTGEGAISGAVEEEHAAVGGEEGMARQGAR